MQVVGPGPVLHPPIFCATENAPVRRWKRAPGAAAPGPCWSFYKRVPRPVEIRNRLCFYYRCRSSGENVGDLVCYRFLSVDATARLPCVRGAVRRGGAENDRGVVTDSPNSTRLPVKIVGTLDHLLPHLLRDCDYRLHPFRHQCAHWYHLPSPARGVRYP